MRAARLFVTALFCWVLSSCGGGSSVALNTGGGVGTGGTGITLGTVTGFGSVVIDGTSYSSASPQYYAQSSQGEADAAAPGDVELGSQVQVELDAQGNPSSVLIAPDLVGAISGMDAAGFSVNGVRVRYSSAPSAGPMTYFSGLTGPGAVTVGMQVAVSGVYGLDLANAPYFQATLVERLPDVNPITRISGVLSGLNASTKTFQIGTVTVGYGAATRLDSTGAAIANGQFVNVWSNQPLRNGGKALTANSLRIRSLLGRSGTAQFSGLVSSLTGSGFALGAIAVDTSALPAKTTGLTAGQYVTVQGSIDARTGTVMATALASYASQPVATAIQGTITGYLASNAFFVRGVPVDASTAHLQNGTSLASLADGVYVTLVGAVGAANSGVIVASSLSVTSQAPTGETVDYRGTVSQLQNGSFVLTSQNSGNPAPQSLSLAANVSYSNGSASQLINGATVEVEATKTATGLSAYSIAFIGAQPSNMAGGGSALPVLIHGRVDDLGASSMSVSGINIQLNGIAAQNGTLANGAKVDVWLSVSGQNNIARSITIVN